MKRSTRAFVDEARKLNDYSIKDLLHGYAYARWPYLYIGIALGEHPIAKTYRKVQDLLPARRSVEDISNNHQAGMADTYHGKVLLPMSAHSLVLVQEDVDLRDLEHVIPYPTARDIVLQNPDQIVALECPCRSVREDPCLPLDVCMIVGEPFAGFILEHHPERSKRLSRGQAVNLLEQEHQRGHVHHAFFKDAMLGRFYAICNCCSCCCGAIQSMRNGSPMIVSSGYLAYVDEAICIGCESCQEACNFDALSMLDGMTTIAEDECMGCGICIDTCPEGALRLEREPSKGVPLEITKLMDAAVSTYS
jgi:ferredoxin